MDNDSFSTCSHPSTIHVRHVPPAVVGWLTTPLLLTQNGNDIGCRTTGRRAEHMRTSDGSDGPIFPHHRVLDL